MRVNYDATVDEIADGHLRLFLATETADRDRLVASSATGGLVGLLVFLLFSGLGPAISVPLAVIATVFGFVQYRRHYDEVVRKKTRRAVVEHLGSEEPVPVSIEALPEALLVEQLDSSMRFAWDRVAQIIDRPIGLEIQAERPAAVVIVRSRAFANIVERAAFVRLARTYQAGGATAVETEALPTI